MNKNNIKKQGIDGCTFSIISKGIFQPFKTIQLKNSTGNIFGTLKQSYGNYTLFICPPKYMSNTNERPFGISDFPHLYSMKRDIESVLKKAFPKGYYIDLNKIEINITDTMVGKCKCENLFGLLCDSLLHHKQQNILYVSQTKDSLIDRDIPGFVSRTVGNQWKLKCYDKQKQLDIEMGIEISEPLVRIEFILLSRKIKKLLGKDHSIANIFSEKTFMCLINEYTLLIDNLIENYVKPHLSNVNTQLVKDLNSLNRPTDVYCLRKQVIHDKIQMQKALKTHYKKHNQNDISNQVLYGLNKKFTLPSNTLDTIRKFHDLSKINN